ncbi:MAG: AraC family transcriptional regulator [Kiritimatiellia bacterium]
MPKKEQPVKEVLPVYDPAAPLRLRWTRGIQYDYPLHWHPEIEIQMVARGSGKYLINGHIYAINRNSLVVIRPRDFHKFIPDQVPFERVTVVLNTLWMGRDWRVDRKLPRHTRLSGREVSQIFGLLRRVQHEVDGRRPLWDDMTRMMVTQLMVLLRRVTLRPAPPPLRPSPLMNQLIAYLDDHYDQPLSLAQLARYFGFSRYHLSHCFSEIFGMGIKNYIIQRRVAEARGIIEKNRALSLSSVAGQVGFNDYAAFHRAFLKIVGLPPSHFRDRRK